MAAPAPPVGLNTVVGFDDPAFSDGTGSGWEEATEVIPSAEVSLAALANQLTRLNDNLEKLMVKPDPYAQRYQIPVSLAISPEAFQRLQQLLHRG